MTLRVWIDKTGQKEVSQLLNVDRTTVSSWRRHKALPRPTKMVLIHKMTKGKVSYQEMVVAVARNHKK